MKGRPPDPNRGQRKTGNRKKTTATLVELRSVAGGKLEPLAPGLPAEPPAHLPEGAKEVWRELVADLRNFAGLAGTDRIMLEQLAITIAVSRSLSERLDHDGLMSGQALDGSMSEITFGVVHPLIDKLVKVNRQVALLSERFGLDPLSRIRLGVQQLEGHSKALELERSLAED